MPTWDNRISFWTWNALTVFLVGVALSTAFNDAFQTPKLFLLRAFTLLALPFLLWRWISFGKVTFRKGWAPWLGVAFLMNLLVVSGFSQTPWLSQAKTFEYLTWILFFLWVWISFGEDGAEDKNLRMGFALGGMEILSAPVVLYAFVQHFGWDPVAWNPGGTRVFSFLQNADAFAAFLAPLTSLSAVRFLNRPAIPRAILLGADFAALFWSYSRGPFVALVLVGVLVFLLILRFDSHSTLLPRMFFLSGFAIIIFLSMFVFSRNRVDVGRFSPMAWQKDANVVARGYLYRKGMEVLAVHPWGVGPGNFSSAYLPLRGDDPPFYRTRLAVGESTHNTFLDVAVETGWLGGLLFLAIWLSAFVSLLSSLSTRAAKDVVFPLELLVPLAVTFVSLQFIYPDVAIEALSSYILGLSALFNPTKAVRVPRSVALVVLIFSLFFLAIGGGYAARVAVADFYAGRGNRAMSEERWKDAAAKLSLAVLWNPWDPRYFQKLGSTYENEGNAREALANYNQAVRINDRNPFYWADIGRLAATHHWRRRAITAYAHAVQLDPYNYAWYHDGALSCLNLGAYRMAFFFAKEAFRLNPNDPANSLYLSEAKKALNP